jgi:ABC-type branched-subunit amino acid transport system permease subunit
VERNVGVLRDLPSLDDRLPFLLLFGVLLLSRRGLFEERAVQREARDIRSVDPRIAAAAGLVALLGVAVLPHVYDTRVPVFTLGAVFVVVFASLHLLVEVSNQVSLCHVAFVAIGATTFSHVTVGAGLPWGVGVLAAALVAVPIGAIVAIPAIRLSGLFLALATLGFGILTERLAYQRGFMFGAIGQRTGARPAILGLDGDDGYFYLCVGIAVVAIAAVVLIRRSRLGRLLNALADAPVALATQGATTNVTRVLVFCISAAMAGLAGALYVGVTGSVSSSGVSSSALISFNALLWLAVLSFVGRSTVVAPVLAAVALVVAPSYVTDPDTVQYQTLLFGLVAVGVATYGPDLTRFLREDIVRGGSRRSRSPVAARTQRVGLIGGRGS